MNVKCPNAGKLACNGEDCGLLGKCRRGVIQGIEISTPELIAELERRRPKDCAKTCMTAGSQECGACVWGIFIGEENGQIKDQFTPLKGKDTGGKK